MGVSLVLLSSSDSGSDTLNTTTYNNMKMHNVQSRPNHCCTLKANNTKPFRVDHFSDESQSFPLELLPLKVYSIPLTLVLLNLDIPCICKQ